MKLKNTLLLLVAGLLLLNVAFAQSPIDQFNKAKEFYDNNNQLACISLLKTVEKSVGANPKIYSLFVQSYLADKDYVNAKITLNKFKKLIGANSTDAIKSILDLENEIDLGLGKLDNAFSQTIAQKNMEMADLIINKRASINIAYQSEVQKKFESQKQNLLKNATKPEFPNGLRAMNDFILANIAYPRKALQNEITGTVIVSFFVETDGQLSNIKVLNSLFPDLDSEAKRVVSAMPKWKPAMLDGELIQMQSEVAIVFSLK